MAKVMLVEDDKALREIYNIRLASEGYDIISAGDGEEALAIAVRERPDLILSDVMMPKISGFDMLDIIRSTPETKNIKVIMMTALSSDEQRKRGENLGADKYLVKSQVGIEDVVNAVHEVLNDRPTDSADPADASAQTPPAPSSPSEATPPALPTAPTAPTTPIGSPAPASAQPVMAPVPMSNAQPAPGSPPAPVVPTQSDLDIPRPSSANPPPPLAPPTIPNRPPAQAETIPPSAPISQPIAAPPGGINAPSTQ